MRITVDTNVFPIDDLESLAAVRGIQLERVSVTDRELENSLISVGNSESIMESGVWGESRWGSAVWDGPESPLEEILSLITSNAFPRQRANLSDGQRRQLRDAMIFCAHVRTKNPIFATSDRKAFISNGRRGRLEARFQTRILDRKELADFLRSPAA